MRTALSLRPSGRSALLAAMLCIPLFTAGPAPRSHAVTVQVSPAAACIHTGDYTLRLDGSVNGYELTSSFSALGSPRRDDGRGGGGVVTVRLSGDITSTIDIAGADLGRPGKPGDGFGTAVIAAPVNSKDECSDLIIGVPGANKGRGAVVVVPGTTTGFRNSSASWLPTKALRLKPGDRLGAALTAIDTKAGVLIVAGAPGRDVRGAKNAGALVTWLIKPGGAVMTIPKPAQPKLITQGAGRMRGRSETGDRFGSVIAARDFDDNGNAVTVGIPDEDISTAKDAGAVARLAFVGATLKRSKLLWQGSGLPGKSVAGDRCGAAVTTYPAVKVEPGYSNELVGVGVPGKDADGLQDSGAVIRRVFSAPFEVITQNSPGVPDDSEAGDRFGVSVAWADIPAQEYILVVGAPGEDTPAGADAGAVTFLGSEPSTAQVTGRSAGDLFGSRLVVLSDIAYEEDREDLLLIGAPGVDLAEDPVIPDVGAYLRVSQEGIADSELAGTGDTAGERFGG